VGVVGFTHIGICVADPERSRRFYQDVLGFEPVSELEIDGYPTSKLMELDEVELRCLFLERDGVRIELMHQHVPGVLGSAEATPMNQRGFTHFALRIDDFERTLKAIIEAGGQLIEATRIVEPGFRSKVICALDPDGVRIELVAGDGDPFAPIGRPLSPAATKSSGGE